MGQKAKLWKYGAKMALQWICYMMLISAFMIIFSYLDGVSRFWKEGNLIEGLSFLFPLDLYMMSVAALPIMAGSMCKAYFPLYVSMGFVRKKAFVYIVAIETAAMAAVLLIVNILWRVTGENLGAETEYIPAMAALLVAMCGFGMLFGGIIIRFGTVGAVIFILTFVGIAGIAGFVVMFAGTTRLAAMGGINFSSLEFLSVGSLGMAALAAGVLVCGVCCFVAWKLMKKTEIRL